MEAPHRQSWSYAAVGLAVAIVALVVLTSLITAAASSVNANDKLDETTGRLETLYWAEKQRNADAEERAKAATERGRRIIALAKSLQDQLQQTQRELGALSSYLRAKGYDVPEVTPPARPPERPPSTSPKGGPGSGPEPSPTAPTSTPTPTPAKPSAITEALCRLAPVLCPKE